MNIDRASAFLVAFCGGCLLVLSWAACSVASEFSAKDADESVRVVHIAMERDSLRQQDRKPAFDGKDGDVDRAEESGKKDVVDEEVAEAPSGLRPSVLRVPFWDPPYLQINLPSWCGVVPYPLPPPARHPA